MTPYVYAANNPVLLIDPDGKDFILSITNQFEAFRFMSYLGVLYATKQGENQISTINKSFTACYVKSAGLFEQYSSQFSSYSKTMYFNYKDGIYATGHEVDHNYLNELQWLPKSDFEEAMEGSAVSRENYYRAVFGDIKSFKTERDMGGIFGGTLKFPDDKNAYNSEGEQVKITGFKYLTKPDETGKTQAEGFIINKYDADAPEIKDAKDGIIINYDYTEKTGAAVKKMAILIQVKVK